MQQPWKHPDPEFQRADAEALARQEQWGEYWITAWHSPVTRRWTALAKRSPFVDGGPISEPGDLWMEVGDTEEIALDRIKDSLIPKAA